MDPLSGHPFTNGSNTSVNLEVFVCSAYQGSCWLPSLSPVSLLSLQLLLTGQWLQRKDTVPLNIDARDKIGRTALFHATLNASVDVADFLLDAGACESR